MSPRGPHLALRGALAGGPPTQATPQHKAPAAAAPSALCCGAGAAAWQRPPRRPPPSTVLVSILLATAQPQSGAAPFKGAKGAAACSAGAEPAQKPAPGARPLQLAAPAQNPPLLQLAAPAQDPTLCHCGTSARGVVGPPPPLCAGAGLSLPPLRHWDGWAVVPPPLAPAPCTPRATAAAAIFEALHKGRDAPPKKSEPPSPPSDSFNQKAFMSEAAKRLLTTASHPRNR